MERVSPISPKSIPNDEPTLFDYLGETHDVFVQELAQLIKNCKPPYVIGVHGSWGSGKTSILEKLWMHLSGSPHRTDDNSNETVDLWCKKHILEYYEQEVTGNNILPHHDKYPDALRKAIEWHTNQYEGFELVWFSPWQFQFEENPAVALLQEIRSHFTLKQKISNESKKLFDVLIYSSLHLVDELSNIVKTAEKRGKEYERNNYEMRLFSQHFHETLQKAIDILLKDIHKNRLVVFIDDLDRCHKDRVLKMIEAFRLYLGANNCVFVMAMDRQVIEEAICRENAAVGLNSDKREEDNRTQAHAYLEKIVQTTCLVPTPLSIQSMVLDLFDKERDEIKKFALEWFDQCLPHNPRKVKAFSTFFRNYIRSISGRLNAAGITLDLPAAFILSYLGFFEEEIYRRVELNPDYFSVLWEFATTNDKKKDPMLGGLSLPIDVLIELLIDEDITTPYAHASWGRSFYISTFLWNLKKTEADPKSLLSSIKTHRLNYYQHSMGTD